MTTARAPLARAYVPILLAGTVGTLLIAAGGSLVTPLTSNQAGAARAAIGDAAFLLGVAVLVAAWFRLVRTRPAARTVVVIAAAWALPLLLAPPLASRDVHSYAAQGEIVARGLDPYTDPPAALRDPDFVGRVDPIWRRTPAPYGPGWLAAGGLVTRLAGREPQPAVTGFRIVALAGVVALGAATAALATDRGPALALTIANPLTLLHLVSGSHNEAWMVALGVAGVAAARRRNLPAAVVLIGLAAAVKAPALALLPFVGWQAAASNRLRNATLTTLGGGATLAAVGAATGLGWGWIQALSTPGTIRTALAPVTGLGVVLGEIADRLGLAPAATVLAAVRAVAFLGMAAVLAYLLFRGRGLAATGGAMTVMAFLNPAVHVWYALWGLPLLAVDDEHTDALLRMSAVLAFVILPDGSSLLTWIRPVRFLAGAAVVWVAVWPLWRTILRRATTGTSSADSGPQRAGDGGSPVARPA